MGAELYLGLNMRVYILLFFQHYIKKAKATNYALANVT